MILDRKKSYSEDFRWSIGCREYHRSLKIVKNLSQTYKSLVKGISFLHLTYNRFPLSISLWFFIRISIYFSKYHSYVYTFYIPTYSYFFAFSSSHKKLSILYDLDSVNYKNSSLTYHNNRNEYDSQTIPKIIFTFAIFVPIIKIILLTAYIGELRFYRLLLLLNLFRNLSERERFENNL